MDQTIITAAIVSTITGAIGAVINYIITNVLIGAATDKAKAEKAEETKRKESRYKLEDKHRDQATECIQYIQHGCAQMEEESERKYWNGDLKSRVDNLTSTNEAIHDLDAEQLAKINSK